MNKQELKKIIKETIIKEISVISNYIDLVDPMSGGEIEIRKHDLDRYKIEQINERLNEEEKDNIITKYNPRTPWEFLYYYWKEYGRNKTSTLWF